MRKLRMQRRKLARVLIEGKAKNAAQALEMAGYTPKTARARSKQIINSPEVKEELTRLGFTEDHAKDRVASILNAKLDAEKITPDHQLRAAELVMRVFGSFAPEKHQVMTLSKLIHEAIELEEREQK